MPIGTSDGQQYESEFQHVAGIDEVLGAKTPMPRPDPRGRGSDLLVHSVEPPPEAPRDPLSPLFDPFMRTQSDVPIQNPRDFERTYRMPATDPRLQMNPDKGQVLEQPHVPVEKRKMWYETQPGKAADTGPPNDFSPIPEDWKNLHSMEWTGNPKELTTLSDHITGLVKGIAKGERTPQSDATGATLLRLRDALQGKPMPPEQIINDLMSAEPLGIPLKGLGNLLRSMGVLGPVEKQIDKPISKDLHTMTDEQLDPIIEGQKYAMSNITPFPQMGGLTAEIDKQAGGFSSGPAGTGKRAVESTVSGINPAGGITKPKAIKAYEIWDNLEKKVVSGQYKTDSAQRKRARTRADKMNLDYGAHRYSSRPIFEEDTTE